MLLQIIRILRMISNKMCVMSTVRSGQLMGTFDSKKITDIED